MRSVIDNDILLKGAQYGLLTEFLRAVPCRGEKPGILGAIQFILKKKLPTSTWDGVREVFESALEVIEPSHEEQVLAARLEYLGVQNDLDLDEGESLLCAILVSRGLKWFVTGDKRAISAFEQICWAEPTFRSIEGRVICLEQLLIQVLEMCEPALIRDRICQFRSVDTAVAICFNCYSPLSTVEVWRSGLDSYISHIRQVAPTVLSENSWAISQEDRIRID